MPGDDNDAVFRSRELGNDVAHRKLACRCIGGEKIVGDLNSLQMSVDVRFELPVILAADGAGTERGHFARVLHGSRRIDRRQRPRTRGRH